MKVTKVKVEGRKRGADINDEVQVASQTFGVF